MGYNCVNPEFVKTTSRKDWEEFRYALSIVNVR
jgi:hypothetical protein